MSSCTDEKQVPLIKFIKLNPEYTAPKKATECSAGYDIYYNGEDKSIHSGEAVPFPTGIVVVMPNNFCAKVNARSGLFKTYNICAFPGLIDADYNDQLVVMLENRGLYPYVVKNGDRIAQLVFHKKPKFITQEEVNTEHVASTTHSGFGSTGK
jgi:dUTP pyrophosphatase